MKYPRCRFSGPRSIDRSGFLRLGAGLRAGPGCAGAVKREGFRAGTGIIKLVVAHAGLKEEMEFLGPVKMRDVEGAQADIVGKVRSLEETGEIVLSGGSDDVII